MAGQSITLTAQTEANWHFQDWTKGTEVLTAPLLNLSLDRDTVITATFEPDWYEFQITILGSGTVEVTPAGLILMDK